MSCPVSYRFWNLVCIKSYNPIRKEDETIETLINSTTKKRSKNTRLEKRVYLHHRTKKNYRDRSLTNLTESKI